MKKSKKILAILGTMLNVPISIAISSFIHIFLTKQDIPRNLIDFQKIVVNEKYLPLFFLVLGFIELLIITGVIMNKNNNFYSKLDTITDKIQTPQRIGQGQHRYSQMADYKGISEEF